MTYDEIVNGLNSDVIKTKDCSLYNAWHGNGGGYCYSLKDAMAGLATSDILAEINFREFDKAFAQAMESDDKDLKRMAYQKLAKMSVDNRYSTKKADWAGEFQLGLADRLMVLIEKSDNYPDLKIDALQTIADIYSHEDYRFYDSRRWAKVLGENLPMLIEAAPDCKKGAFLSFALKAYNCLSDQDLDAFKVNMLKWRALGTNAERRKKADLVAKRSGQKDSFWTTLGKVSYYSGSELNRLAYRLGVKKDGDNTEFDKLVAEYKKVFATKSDVVNVKPQNSR